MEKLPSVPHVPQPEKETPLEMTPAVSREPQFEIPQPVTGLETVAEGSTGEVTTDTEAATENPLTPEAAAPVASADDPAGFEAKLFGDQ